MEIPREAASLAFGGVSALITGAISGIHRYYYLMSPPDSANARYAQRLFDDEEAKYNQLVAGVEDIDHPIYGRQFVKMQARRDELATIQELDLVTKRSRAMFDALFSGVSRGLTIGFFSGLAAEGLQLINPHLINNLLPFQLP